MFMGKLKIFLDLRVNLIHEGLMRFTPTLNNKWWNQSFSESVHRCVCMCVENQLLLVHRLVRQHTLCAQYHSPAAATVASPEHGGLRRAPRQLLGLWHAEGMEPSCVSDAAWLPRLHSQDETINSKMCPVTSVSPQTDPDLLGNCRLLWYYPNSSSNMSTVRVSPSPASATIISHSCLKMRRIFFFLAN